MSKQEETLMSKREKALSFLNYLDNVDHRKRRENSINEISELYEFLQEDDMFNLAISFGKLCELKNDIQSLCDILLEVLRDWEEFETVEEKLNMNLNDLQFSTRTYNVLRRVGTNTVRDIVAKSEKELMSTRGFGKTNLEELNSKLKKLGLKLKTQEQKIFGSAEEIIDADLKDLQFSTRTYNLLRRAGANTFMDVLRMSEEDLMSVRGFGKSNLQDVNSKLKELEELDEFGELEKLEIKLNSQDPNRELEDSEY